MGDQIRLSTAAPRNPQKTRPYDREFSQHLTDHNIHTRSSSSEADLTELREALAVQLPSVYYSAQEFINIRSQCLSAQNEEDVMKILWTIAGPDDIGHPSAMKTQFNNLAAIADETALAEPDLYYGARPEEVSRQLRNELDKLIVPSNWKNRPVVPNFFVEVKGPSGAESVAEQQARIDGALGCRAMHSIRTYGMVESNEYDGKPYAFSCTLTSTTLVLYAHHISGPAAWGDLPHYFMTAIDQWALWPDVESLCRAVTAFRNVRLLAKKYRDIFIRAANARVPAKASIPRPPGGLEIPHAYDTSPLPQTLWVGRRSQQQSQVSADAVSDDPQRRPKRKRVKRSSSIKGNSPKRPALLIHLKRSGSLEDP